jgi:ABC-type proline/glycine betaine transport system ATPase subunit
MTVKRNIVFAMQAAGKWSDDGPCRIEHILAPMGVASFRRAFPEDLSGGMRQRVAIARILAIDSPGYIDGRALRRSRARLRTRYAAHPSFILE